MRILVIEDHLQLAQTLARTLREDGYAVDTSTDGADGLMKAKGVDYDAIILDVSLPSMDGWSVLTALRSEKRTPVLMLTARDTVPDRVRGLNAGADDYLTKPCDLIELLARIRALIRRSAGEPRRMIELGDIVVDLSAREVRKTGELVRLTAREFGLVEFLALRRGQVVSRTTLYEHLLDEEEDTLSNLIDVYIYNVRKKLGQDFIVTRRGLGYSIPQ